jgi:predicted unusual protein kinase regulating ubiquinone biosynthesis (AarF/ABC1/UbiB family)
MDWIEHTPLHKNFPQFTITQKKTFLEDLSHFFLGGLARHQSLHADLNPGNLGFTHEGKITLLDFGSIWKPQKKHQLFL